LLTGLGYEICSIDNRPVDSSDELVALPGDRKPL
jgi:hypothetical protein